MTDLGRRAWLSEGAIVAGLLLLPLLFWWMLWAPAPADRAVIPEGDFTGQYYPLQLFAARELAAGRLPGWNPYLNAGQPGLADIQTGTYYPLNLLPNLLLALLGRPYGIDLLMAQVVVHYALASLFTYLFGRHLARRAGARRPAARFAGAVAALSFTYAGYLTTFPVQQLTILETAIWLPLVLFFLDRAVHQPPALPQLVLAGLALANALLAGHPQTAMYVVYAVLAYGLFLIWPRRQAIRNTQYTRRVAYHASRITYHVGFPLALGATLAAVQLIPSLQFIARSTRAGLDYEAVAWGFPLVEITHLLYPGYFGGSPQYVGILPPILAVAALFVVRARREVVFWLVVGLVAFVLAFGGSTALYDLAYLLAPGFGLVRNQERIIYLFSFALSVLAGYGALSLVQPLPRRLRRGFRAFGRGLAWLGVAFLALTALWYLGFVHGEQQGVEINLAGGVLRHHSFLLLVLGGSIILVWLRLTGRARRSWLAALALGLIWLNLFTINWRFNLAEPVTNLPGWDRAAGPFPETGLVSFLKSQPGTFRLSSAGLLPGGSNAGIVHELEDITGNTPLRLEAFQQFEDRLGSWRRWQLLNIHYVLSDRDLAGPGLELVYEEGAVKAYRLGDPLPRAWLVHGTRVADDGQDLALLNAKDFDPRAEAVLAPAFADLALPGPPAAGGAAQVIAARPGRLVLDVSAARRALLVVSQPFYPGWQAAVDGEAVPLARVDYFLQGIPIPAGEHRVELGYRLSPWPAIVSGLALAGCLVVLIVRRRV